VLSTYPTANQQQQHTSRNAAAAAKQKQQQPPAALFASNVIDALHFAWHEAWPDTAHAMA
jgi:hypothetical protein